MVEVLCARGAELHSEAWHPSHTPGERRNHASLPGSCRGNSAAFGGRVVNLRTGSEVHGRLREGGMELSSASTDLK